MDDDSDTEAWAYASRYDDIDAQAAHFRGFGQHYEQLSGGPFAGQFQSFDFGQGLTVHLESANRELVQSAVTPAGRLGLSVLAAQSPPCVLNGTTLAPGDLILYPARQIIEGRTPERMQILCIDLEAGLLPGDPDTARGVRIVHDPARAGRLRELISAGVAAFRSLGNPARHPAARGDFNASIAELAWQLTQPGSIGPQRAPRRARRRALAVYARAREIFIAELESGVSIAQVCKAVGVSRRSLEGAFRSAIGVSPALYVRTLQLNCIRRDLLSPAELAVSIGVIAARYGVWHWSRCSQEYRRLFGELPSQTRRRLAANML